MTWQPLENFLQGFAGPVWQSEGWPLFPDKRKATKTFEDGKIRSFLGHYTDHLDERALKQIQVQKAERKEGQGSKTRKRLTYQEKQEGKHWRYWSSGGESALLIRYNGLTLATSDPSETLDENEELLENTLNAMNIKWIW